jgi:hypothetical protein
MERGCGRHRSSVVMRRDGDVVGFGQSREAADSDDAFTVEIGPQDVHHAFTQQVLVHRHFRDRPAEAERGHALVGDFANGPKVRGRAGLVEPEQVEAFERCRDARGVAGREIPAAIENKIDVVGRPRPQPIEAGSNRVVISLPLVARRGRRDRHGERLVSGFDAGGERGRELIVRCAGQRRERADLESNGPAQKPIHGRAARFRSDVQQRHVYARVEWRAAPNDGVRRRGTTHHGAARGIEVRRSLARTFAPSGQTAARADADDRIGAPGGRLANGKCSEILDGIRRRGGNCGGSLKRDCGCQSLFAWVHALLRPRFLIEWSSPAGVDSLQPPMRRSHRGDQVSVWPVCHIH